MSSSEYLAYRRPCLASFPYNLISEISVSEDLIQHNFQIMAGMPIARSASGYIYCNYLNCTSGETASNPTHYFVETGNDSFLRQMTPANFVTQLVSDGLARSNQKLDDFGTPDDNTDLNASTTRHGLLKKLGGGTTNFLRADGVWATPPGEGGAGWSCACRAYRSAAMAVQTATYQKIQFDAENYDLGGNFAKQLQVTDTRTLC